MTLETILAYAQTLLLLVIVLYFGFQLTKRLDRILEKLDPAQESNEDDQAATVDDNLDYPYPIIARELAKQKANLRKEQTPEAKEKIRKIERFLNRGWLQFSDVVARVFMETEGELPLERILKAVFDIQYPNLKLKDMGGGLEVIRSIKMSVEHTLKAFMELGCVSKAGENYRMTSQGKELFEKALKERLDFEEKFLALFSGQKHVTPGCSGNTCVFLIQNDIDDASELPTGAFSVADENIYLGNGEQGDPITAGLRFMNVDIPSGIIVERAFLEFVADGPYANSVFLEIHAEDQGDVNTFSDGARPSSRLATTSSVSWKLTPNESWTCGQTRTSPDISPILQSIFNRPDWKRGNAISILVKSTTGGDKNAHRRIIGYLRAKTDPEYDPPRLILQYHQAVS